MLFEGASYQYTSIRVNTYLYFYFIFALSLCFVYYFYLRFKRIAFMDEQEKTSYKLPMEWIDRIFKRFAEIWGDDYTKLFSSEMHVDIERTRWSSGLYGVTADEIRRVLEMCRARLIQHPPNAVEFFHYCKGHTLPLTKPAHTIPSERKEIGKQYLKLIQDKLHGRFNKDGEVALSTLNQSVLDNKDSAKPTHWQSD
jgi:hypothetical protein